MFLEITAEIRIPFSEIQLSYARSSGPGGQNVNKVNSKAVLRWDALGSPSLPPGIRSGLLARLGPRLSASGELVIASDRFRDQARNREDCIEKLKALVAWAAFRKKPRKKTKPSRSSRLRAREEKTRHARKKKLRKPEGSGF